MNINWFPGHMKKTRELLKDNLKLVDLVVEILDSRIPLSSRNPEIDSIIQDKPRVVLLNKCDLANPQILRKWEKYYKDQGIETVAINAVKGVNFDKIIEKAKEVTKDKMDKLISKGRKERPIRMMIVGIPNVGKSSLINKLAGKKSAQVGDRPGVTKAKQWVKLKGNLELLDTPGILWPKFEDQNVAINLALTGAIKDEILDVETLALKLIERLVKLSPESLLERYMLDELAETPLEIMEAIGKKRGCLLRGNEYDYTRIANILLNEFRAGSLGQISIESPDEIGKEDEEKQD